MRYLAAYLLLQLGGNENPSVADITKVIGAVGIDCDAENANKVIESLKGKNVDQLVVEGQTKLASVPSGGAAAPAAVAAVGSAPAEVKEEKKEEKKKEESESEDDDMGFGLFD